MRDPIVSIVFLVLSKIVIEGRSAPIIKLDPIETAKHTQQSNIEIITDIFAHLISNYMNKTMESIRCPRGKHTTYKVGNQGDFVQQARELLVKEGLAQPEDFQDSRLSNIASSERLTLVFNSTVLQSAELATWQSRVEDQAYINRFPAAQFLRSPGADDPRPRHVAAEGEVRRWDDFEFWLYQNAADIGGFEVPWGPWGLNSYMYQQPVSRKEAERLGLVKPGEIVKPINGSRWGATPTERLKQNAKAEVRKVSPEISDQLKAELRAALGNDIIDQNGKLSLRAIQAARAKIGI